MMKKIIFILITVTICLGFSNKISTGELTNSNAFFLNEIPLQLPGTQQYVPNQLVIKLSGDAAGETQDRAYKGILRGSETAGDAVRLKRERAASILSVKYGSEIKSFRPDRHSNYYILETRAGTDLEALRKKMTREPLVEAASPNYIVYLSYSPPNDPIFSLQYHLNNTGQEISSQLGIIGTVGSDISALDGWDWTRGSEDVIIAFVDSGAAAGHEELEDRVIPGYNFVDNNDDTSDEIGHGTFVASVAAAATDNRLGIAGVCWYAKIMPVKIISPKGGGTHLETAAGIRYAADHGAHVINISVGNSMPSFILEEALEYAFNKGAVIVASAGNTGDPVTYPAAYDAYVIAVAATDENDNVPEWSNYGPQVDVAAPGNYIVGATYIPEFPDELALYSLGIGTSYSAAMVSGAAALLISYKPFLSNSQVIELIKITADDVNQDNYPGVDDYIGYGRLNLSQLLGPYDFN